MSETISSHIRVRTARRGEFLDLTDRLLEVVAASGIDNGAAHVFCAHTTCSLVINEWEDGAHHDLREVIDLIAPPSAYYRHDDLTVRTQNLQPDEPVNGHSHVAQMLVGATSQMVPIIGSRAVLGRWQRLMLLELDGPRDRDIYFTCSGSLAPVGPRVPPFDHRTRLHAGR